MGITGLVAQQQKLSLEEAVRWHTLVGITMADAFYLVLGREVLQQPHPPRNIH